jgi:hypothetical protein
MGIVLKPSSIQSQGQKYDANQPDDIEVQIIHFKFPNPACNRMHPKISLSLPCILKQEKLNGIHAKYNIFHI